MIEIVAGVPSQGNTGETIRSGVIAYRPENRVTGL
jgi:hypothetical protein